MRHTQSTIVALTLASSLASADLVGHWKFEEGTGTTTAGDTVNNREGAITGATWSTANLAPVPSGSNAHLEFDGSNNLVQITGYPGVTGTNDRTVAAWVRTSDANVDRAIVSWGTNLGGQKWTFRTQSQNGTFGVLRLEVNGGYIVGNTPVNDGQWHHVAVTWANDGTPNVTDAKLYVDGILDAELDNPAVTPSGNLSRSINTASITDVRIGRDFSNRFWRGGIDDVLAARSEDCERGWFFLHSCTKHFD